MFPAYARRTAMIVTGFVVAVPWCSASSFTDISTSRNATAIQYLNSKGIIGGYADGTFKPNGQINRAELAKILVTATGAAPSVDQYHDCFSDVSTEWFAPSVCYAKEQGWVAGYSDGTFRPSNPVNTAEAIKMILNAEGVSTASSSETDATHYADVDSSAWYAPYVSTASQKGLLEITSGDLGVTHNMTRGLVAESMYRILSIKASGETAFDAPPIVGTDASSEASSVAHASSTTTDDLQKYLDEAKASSDKTTLTKDQFEAEMKTLMQSEMSSRGGRPRDGSGSMPPMGNGPKFGSGSMPPRMGGGPRSGSGSMRGSGGRQSSFESASTFLKYTDSSGQEVLLAVDANGNVIMKWPMDAGHGPRGPSQQ